MKRKEGEPMLMYLNSEYVEEGRAAISPLSPGFFDGFGVYETVKVYSGRVIFIEEHFRRFQAALDIFGLAPDLGTEGIAVICERLVAANGITTGYVKFSCSKSAAGGDDLIVFTGSKHYEGRYEKGFSLCLADAVRDEKAMLTGIKSLNHAENRLQLHKAESAGYGEALFLNTAGMVSEGSRSNIFWIKDASVFTPSAECGLLPGIVRHKTIDICREAGIRVCTGTYGPDAVRDADEVFLTSSLMGIMPVNAFGSKRYGGPGWGMTGDLMRHYDKSMLLYSKKQGSDRERRSSKMEGSR